ncbi:hypothetical protein [Floridanema aerugineum]|uniref:Uncharacterized protein n=1 Tax=Floridaenema aerugineum BLCC-F46 TaxID=3153654 RepID=A0ABV4XER3_9CYAN
MMNLFIEKDNFKFEVIMGIENSILNKDAVESSLLSLKAIRTYQRDRRTNGVKRVELYYEDIEGDWLETWGDEDEDNLERSDSIT